MTEQNNKIFDKHIGNKIRERRKALGLTQGELAQIIGISHQQIQRYESGENPLSMSRLLEISNVLNIKPDYFYENIQASKEQTPKLQTGIINKDPARPLQLLLVEDNITDEILFRKAVAQSEILAELHVMQNPEQVMDFLKSNRPDIIVLDINMPRMNGIELLKEIKKDARLRILPVIMLTNSIRSKDMLDAYANHAGGFIQKNCELDEFYEDINRILQYWSKTTILPNAAG
jgi:CheY-like chemotaxis protein/DNA-binding XRE family transcriptional regulator